MLNRDPNLRPSIKKILEKDFLAIRISNLLSMTVAKHEFGNTKKTELPSVSEERKITQSRVANEGEPQRPLINKSQNKLPENQS